MGFWNGAYRVAAEACSGALWQIAYQRWGKWNDPVDFFVGSLLTGASDALVTVLFYLGNKYYKQKVESQNVVISRVETAKIFTLYWLVSASWQPLVTLGGKIGELITGPRSILFPDFSAGISVFAGNFLLSKLINVLNLLNELKPDPLFMGMTGLCFFIVGPLNLPGSDGGLNNRDIGYASLATSAGGAVTLFGYYCCNRLRSKAPRVAPAKVGLLTSADLEYPGDEQLSFL